MERAYNFCAERIGGSKTADMMDVVANGMEFVRLEAELPPLSIRGLVF